MITLGCSKNLVDSEKILGNLPAGQFTIQHNNHKPTDILIINTCGFIHDAKEESIDTILEAVELQKKGMAGEIIVTGCLSQRYKTILQKEIPEVAAWFGARQPDDLLAYLIQNHVSSPFRRHLTTPSHYAYLKISEGCDRTCSFCAIPEIRGKHISAPMDHLLEEASMLANKGVKELILVAQDLSYYGIDSHGKHMLGQLLEKLCLINGIQWIRLHYAYPHQFPDDVISQMAEQEKICKYLDIPVQHINDDILKSMRRGHTKSGTMHFLSKLRENVPGIALRTTLMVGYPGETEQAFSELVDFVNNIRFERLGVFTYSPEEGTRAHTLRDTVPEHIKLERQELIMTMQSEISYEKNLSLIGQTMKVIIDAEEETRFVARSQYDSPEVDNEVLIEKPAPFKMGRLVDVKITGAAEFDLYAHPVGYRNR